MLSDYEEKLFAARHVVLIVLGALTVASVWVALSLKFDTDLEKQLPAGHPYARIALAYKEKIAGLNSLQIVVETKAGDIWNAKFLKSLCDVTQELTYLPGISREAVVSLWTSNTFIYEVTEGAVEGRQLIPATIVPNAMTPADVLRVRADAFKGGYRGRLFALDGKSAMIHAAVEPLMPDGTKTDIVAVANALEAKIRRKFEKDGITIRIIGFTTFVGAIANEATNVLKFFALAFLLNALALWYYARSLMLTIATVISSAASIAWLLAIVHLANLSLHPLGMVVPFLIYIIGISHGVQQINRFLAAIVHGQSPLDAARRTFRHLLAPGFYALVILIVSFAAILLIPIPFVQDVAIIAVIGIALQFVSNLIMLPLAMSYVPFSAAAIETQRRLAEARRRFMTAFSSDAKPGPALIVLLVSVILGGTAIWNGMSVGVGHRHAGAQELWESSRYNVDSAAIARNFNLDLDTFVIVTVAPVDACVDYQVMGLVERFGVTMRAVEGVKSVMSLPEASRFVYSMVQEGNLKWRLLPKAPDVLAVATSAISDTTGLRNSDCTLLPIALYLTDHRDETLRHVAAAAESFVAQNKMKGVEFRLATGNGGVLYAINDAVREARVTAPLLVLSVIAILVFAAYRDWRAVPCCIAPLVLANALGLWLLSWLDIGLTVTTLPAFILAAGIGVGYGLYLYERIEKHLQEGLPMDEAFAYAMREEGAAVVYTALTLALGVGCWAFSGLKFQADMGWLLAFLILANALAAITVLPAMAVVLDLILPRRNGK